MRDSIAPFCRRQFKLRFNARERNMFQISLEELIVVLNTYR